MHALHLLKSLILPLWIS